MKKPLVSVIIPCKNSSQFIGQCLESIKNQTYKNIEIIIVDNNSTDNTKEIAKKYTRLVFNRGPERSSQVNFGAKKAKGKYLYRVDSDFLIEQNVIKECVERCENEKFDCIAVHNTSDPTISFWSKVRKFERDMYIGDELIVGARFFSKKSFEAVNGFDEELIACEDYDIHNRLLEKGFKIGRINSKEIHLGEPRTLWEITKKSYFYGKTIKKYLEKNKERGKKQISPFRMSYLRNINQLIKHPILTNGLFIMSLCKFGAGGLGLMRR